MLLKRLHIKFMWSCLFVFASHVVAAADFTVAVRAHSGISAAEAKWTPTIDYLNQAIPEHRFFLKPIINLGEITQAAAKKEFDFVLTNPSSYIDIKKHAEAKALVTLNNKRENTAQTRFGSVIFVRADREDILSLQDLKGKAIEVVSKRAFGGWRVAWGELLDNGIDPFSDLSKVMYSDNNIQEEVLFDVLNGKADAGVVRTDMIERMAKDKKINLRSFRILNGKQTKGFPFFHSSVLYPEWPLVALPHVPAEVYSAVKTKLMAIPSNSKAAVTGKYIGWVDALDYTPVERLLQKLEQKPLRNDFANISSIAGILALVLIFFILMILIKRQKAINKLSNKSSKETPRGISNNANPRNSTEVRDK